MAKYRTFWRRFWAGFIDTVVILPIPLVDEFLSALGPDTVTVLAWNLFGHSVPWLRTAIC